MNAGSCFLFFLNSEVFTYNQSFTLEYGITLPSFHLAYTTYGELNSTLDNVVWVFHALTANSDAAEWWPGLVGDGKLFDPASYFIVCVNMPGSCYGSIGPLEVNSTTGKPWYHDFPFFTTRDMVRAYQHLKEALGINRIHIGIGGSMGGQQLLEWAVLEPELFDYIFPLATNAFHSPWGVAFNTAQRMAIEADATWKEKNAAAGLDGMKAARSTALLSYRHYDAYLSSQPRDPLFPFAHGWDGASSYQRYQGEKLARRFNAFSYYVLSQSMDAHDISRNRGDVADVLNTITANTLVISIESDILFPVKEQEFLATHIKGAEHTSIESPYGHDGFLLEFEQIEKAIKYFFHKQKNKSVFLSRLNESNSS